MNKIDVSKLSAEELASLQNQLKEVEKRKDEEKEAYKNLVDEDVRKIVPSLVAFQEEQQKRVADTFAHFEEVIKLKQDIYGFSEEQSSHTFTCRDGSASVVIGHNEIIGFDGTESAGVQKIREYIKNLSGDDEKRQIMAGLLETFMKPNKKGELNPSRVAELIAQKDKVNDPTFSEGVDIIVNAQFKTRTSSYVRGWMLDESGERVEFRIAASR